MDSKDNHGFASDPRVAPTGNAAPSIAPSTTETAVDSQQPGPHTPTRPVLANIVTPKNETEVTDTPMSPRHATSSIFYKKRTGLELDDYFFGPRDINKYSKWPLFFQMEGSIMPSMIIPIFLVGAWATTITVLSKFVHHVNLGVNPILLTITGFVVALGLSFRSSTAYERYSEGRRLWGQLILTCQTMGRVIWIHTQERPESAREDILSKLTAMNLLVAFAVSLKHKLRFEPYTNYEDIEQLIANIDTFAQLATKDNRYQPKKRSIFKTVGEHLGLTFATSNPRKAIKRATEPLGNLPLEILCYLSAFVDELVANGQLTVPMQQTTAYNGISALNDVLVQTERIINTPLPIAYAIAISQITWLYVILLPFQLYNALKWITIPATMAAAYIILGLLLIGSELENPFGNDTNDLPLDLFCLQIVQDLEVISSRPKPRMAEYVKNPNNKMLYPMSTSTYSEWVKRPETAIRNALRNRPYVNFQQSKPLGGVP